MLLRLKLTDEQERIGAPVHRGSQACHRHQRALGRRSPAIGHDQRERTRPHHGNRATRCEDQPQNREIDSGCTLVVLLSAQDDENRPPKGYPASISRRANKTPPEPVSARWRGSFKSPRSFVRPGTPVQQPAGFWCHLRG